LFDFIPSMLHTHHLFIYFQSHLPCVHLFVFVFPKVKKNKKLFRQLHLWLENINVNQMNHL